eukprot:14012696-Alexandrium_andersonii.AAC.1
MPHPRDFGRGARGSGAVHARLRSGRRASTSWPRSGSRTCATSVGVPAPERLWSGRAASGAHGACLRTQRGHH